jgi:hypothetical protein
MSYQLLVHNWRGRATPGDITDYDPTEIEWIRREPDLYWPLNDADGVAVVEDWGTKQYTNETSSTETTELDFGATALAAGTAVEVVTGDAFVRTTEPVDVTDHYFWTQVDCRNRANTDEVLVQFTVQGTTVNQFIQVRVNSSGWFVRYSNGPATPVDTDVIAFDCPSKITLRFNAESRTIEAFEPLALEPVDTITMDAGFAIENGVELKIVGEGVIHDDAIIVPTANVTLEEILRDHEPDPYDPDVGIDSVDITPGTPINVGNDQPLRYQTSSWHIREDGFGMIFVNGRADQKYTTSDYGETWTGPIDQSAALDAGGTQDPVVVSLMYDPVENEYCCVGSYVSERNSRVFVSTDNGASWISRGSGFYAWGADIYNGQLSWIRRNAAGAGRLQAFAAPSSGNLSLVYDSINTDNGIGAIWDASGNVYFNAQGSRDKKWDGSTLTDPSGDSTNEWGYNAGHQAVRIPNSAIIFGFSVIINDGVVDNTIAFDAEDPFGDTNPSSVPTSVGYRADFGVIRAIYLAGLSNEARYYFETNSTLAQDGWEDRFFINLDGFEITSNSTLRLQSRTIAVSHENYIFVALHDSTGAFRLSRFQWPIDATIERVPTPTTITGDVKLLINAENVSGTDIGNDVPGSPAGDVTTVYTPVTSTDAKFGTSALVIPYQRPLSAPDPLIQPRWNGAPGLELGNRDFTLEAWYKFTDNSIFGLIGSDQNTLIKNGEAMRWGGFTFSVRINPDGTGRASFYIGRSLTEADDAVTSSPIVKAWKVEINTQWASSLNAGNASEYNHWAVTRENGRIRIFLNGLEAPALGYATVNRSAYIYDSGEPFMIGTYPYPHKNEPKRSFWSQPALMDGIRLIDGQALYTKSFTAPSSPPTAS